MVAREHSFLFDEFEKCRELFLGYANESNATRISVDITDWITNWPDGVVSVYCKNANGDVYKSENAELSGRVVSWITVNKDYLVDGYGGVQIELVSDDTVVRSGICPTLVNPSLVVNTLG